MKNKTPKMPTPNIPKMKTNTQAALRRHNPESNHENQDAD